MQMASLPERSGLDIAAEGSFLLCTQHTILDIIIVR